MQFAWAWIFSGFFFSLFSSARFSFWAVPGIQIMIFLFLNFSTHCLAVAGLFCMAPLQLQWYESALSSLEHPVNETGGPSESGWTQLLSVPEALNQRLPIADVAKYLKNASSSLLHTCSSPLSASSVESRQSCSRLPLEVAFSFPYTAYYRVPNNQSTPEHVFHESKHFGLFKGYLNFCAFPHSFCFLLPFPFFRNVDFQAFYADLVLTYFSSFWLTRVTIQDHKVNFIRSFYILLWFTCVQFWFQRFIFHALLQLRLCRPLT